jgi:hypothetical protein
LLGLVVSSLPAKALTSTELPPQGRRAAAFITGFAPSVDSQFNDKGHLESLVQPLNRDITLDQMASYEPRLKKLQVALNALGPDHLGDSLLMAQLFAHVNASETQYVPGLLWSLNDHLAVGAMVPIIRRSVQSDLRADVANNVDSIARLVGDVGPLRDGLQELKDAHLDSATLEEAIFTDNGYKLPSSFEASGLGDLEFEARYIYFTNDRWTLQLRNNLKLPTSTYNADVTNLFDRSLADGDYSYKLGSYHDYEILRHRLSFHSGLSARWHAPSSAVKAVPKDENDILPDIRSGEQIERVHRQLGWDLDSDLALSYEFLNGVVTISGSYLKSLHTHDRYWGSRGLDYAHLGLNSDTSTDSFELAVQLSSVPLFFKKLFPLPGTLSLAWNQPVRGRNSLYSPFGRLDVIVCF